LFIHLSIDRFEGTKKQVAVLLAGDGTQVHFPKSLLPKGVKAGDILSLTIERDVEATKKVAKQTRAVPGRPEEDRPRRGHQAMTRLAPFIAALALALVPNAAPAQGQPTPSVNLVIDFLDVGQGDSILVRSPEGRTALIDAGPSHDVVALLKQRGVTSIDMVAVSHHHADHYGGMEAVIRAFRPRVFLATNSSHTTPHYLRLLKLVRDGGMQAIFPTDTPRRIGMGSVTLTVFPQPTEDRQDENDNSIGLRTSTATSRPS
jgi:hypothetical protein